MKREGRSKTNYLSILISIMTWWGSNAARDNGKALRLCDRLVEGGKFSGVFGGRRKRTRERVRMVEEKEGGRG